MENTHNIDPYMQEFTSVKREVHDMRQNLFPKGERPMGNKHWTPKNLAS